MKSRYNPDNLRRNDLNHDQYKWGIFYYNPNDSRIIVPKKVPWMGWTLNFANMWSYVILGSFIVLAVVVGYFAN